MTLQTKRPPSVVLQSTFQIRIQIPGVISSGCNLSSIVFASPVIKEFLTATMNRVDPLCMFDQTSVLLRPSRDFLNVSDQSLKVPAVCTIEFLQAVWILQFLPIHNIIISPIHFWYSVNSEAYLLEYRYNGIHEYRWKNACPD